MFYIMSEGAQIYSADKLPKDFLMPAAGTFFTFHHKPNANAIAVISGVITSVSCDIDPSLDLFEVKISLTCLKVIRVAWSEPVPFRASVTLPWS